MICHIESTRRLIDHHPRTPHGLFQRRVGIVAIHNFADVIFLHVAICGVICYESNAHVLCYLVRIGKVASKLLDLLNWEAILHDVIREASWVCRWNCVILDRNHVTGTNVEVDNDLFYLGVRAEVFAILQVNGR